MLVAMNISLSNAVNQIDPQFFNALTRAMSILSIACLILSLTTALIPFFRSGFTVKAIAPRPDEVSDCHAAAD